MNFLTKNPNLKYNIFGGWGGGGGSVAMVSVFFFTKNPNLKKKIFFLRWGRMAWVSEFFTKNPNLKKKKEKNNIFLFSMLGRWGDGK